MADSSDELERLSREQLILKARVLGVERAELMTRVELRDEIVRRSEPDIAQQKRARGFLGVARDLVASVVEAGLNLPDAAALIRGEGTREEWKGPPPVATVTLAEIYATQGHLDRALRMLDEVLEKEPDHDPARALRDRLASGADLPAPAVRRRQRISFADPDPVVVSESQPPPAEPALANAPVPEVVAAPVPEVVAAPVPEVVAAPAPEVVAAPVPEVVAALAPVPTRPPALLTLALSGQRQVYWEVPAGTFDALRSRSPNGRALLRVISFRTRAGKVERNTLDFSAAGEVGSTVLPGLRADSVVRAVLGWEAEGRFQPFLVASELASASPSGTRAGSFRAHPLVSPLSHAVADRALSHCARR